MRSGGGAAAVCACAACVPLSYCRRPFICTLSFALTIIPFTHTPSYCSIITYIFGIGDRHFDNILLHSEGCKIIAPPANTLRIYCTHNLLPHAIHMLSPSCASLAVVPHAFAHHSLHPLFSLARFVPSLQPSHRYVSHRLRIHLRRRPQAAPSTHSLHRGHGEGNGRAAVDGVSALPRILQPGV